MGEIFDTLIRALGSVLDFYFDLLTPLVSDGVGYGLAIILLNITINVINYFSVWIFGRSYFVVFS